jgi:ribosome-associated protein
VHHYIPWQERARCREFDPEIFFPEKGGSSREAKRRQIQRIGKLLRARDVTRIQAALDRLDHSSALAQAELHRTERWRARVLEEGDEAVQALVSEHPDMDTQRLRQLIRNARREQETGKPPRAYRELFRLIREHTRLD